MEKKSINIYYLKMEEMPSSFSSDYNNLSLEPIQKPIDVKDYMKMYDYVGKNYQWLDRYDVDIEEVEQAINADNTYIFYLVCDGQKMGYSELVIEEDYVELLYFGLFPEAVGQGLGSRFLEMMISKAWSFNPKWVQLNTCDLDHPTALHLYQKKGFKIAYTKTK